MSIEGNESLYHDHTRFRLAIVGSRDPGLGAVQFARMAAAISAEMGHTIVCPYVDGIPRKVMRELGERKFGPLVVAYERHFRDSGAHRRVLRHNGCFVQPFEALSSSEVDPRLTHAVLKLADAVLVIEEPKTPVYRLATALKVTVGGFREIKADAQLKIPDDVAAWLVAQELAWKQRGMVGTSLDSRTTQLA